MLVRCTALIISILYIQVKGVQQNGNSNIPNLVLNRTFTFNSQGNGLRSKINPISGNQLNTLQQSDNMNLAKSLQQALNLKQATNLPNFNTQNVNSQSINTQNINGQGMNTQNVNSQQFQNLQQLQPTITGQQAGNIQQSLLLQQPVNSQQFTNSLYPNLPQTINIQPQNPNVQILSQLSDVSNVPNSQLSQTYTATNPTLSNPSAFSSLGTNPTYSYPAVVTNPTSSNPSASSSIGTNPTLSSPSVISSTETNPMQSNLQIGSIGINPTSSNPSVVSSIGTNPASSNLSVISSIGTNPMSSNPSVISYIGSNPTSSNPAVVSYIFPNQVNQPQSQQVLHSSASPGDVISLVSGSPPSELVSAVSPQNQHVSYSGPSPYVVDLSQVTNNIPTTMTSPTFTTLSNQPSLVTILAPPHQHLPHTANSTHLSNPIKVIKPKPCPHAHCKGNHEHINVVCPHGTQTSTFSPPCTDTASTISSLLTSTLTKQASKSSNLKALLPLIFNLIKEKNNCGCHHHHHCDHQCDCPNNTLNRYEGGGEINESYSKQKRYGCNQNYKSDFNSRYANDDYEEYDDRDSYESRRNSKRYEKSKRNKHVSEEYNDYSDEFQDDY